MNAIKFIVFTIALLGLPSANAQVTIDIGAGAFQSEGATLVLLGFTIPAERLFGSKSYYQFNAGGWTGSRNAYVIGVARGLQWDIRQTTIRASLGASLISETNDLLSTPFEFYEQFLIQRHIGGVDLGLSCRHWSNGGIRTPNVGMNFIGLQIQTTW
jgi:hypothetical protein